jgi:beta-lactamase superfamily II metal-dependent hydrolase
MAFVSVGKGNPHGLPGKKTVAELQRREIPLYRTDLHGSSRFRTNGKGWEVNQWGSGFFRPVGSDTRTRGADIIRLIPFYW